MEDASWVTVQIEFSELDSQDEWVATSIDSADQIEYFSPLGISYGDPDTAWNATRLTESPTRLLYVYMGDSSSQFLNYHPSRKLEVFSPWPGRISQYQLPGMEIWSDMETNVHLSSWAEGVAKEGCPGFHVLLGLDVIKIRFKAKLLPNSIWGEKGLGDTNFIDLHRYFKNGEQYAQIGDSVVTAEHKKANNGICKLDSIGVSVFVRDVWNTEQQNQFLTIGRDFLDLYDKKYGLDPYYHGLPMSRVAGHWYHFDVELDWYTRQFHEGIMFKKFSDAVSPVDLSVPKVPETSWNGFTLMEQCDSQELWFYFHSDSLEIHCSNPTPKVIHFFNPFTSGAPQISINGAPFELAPQMRHDTLSRYQGWHTHAFFNTPEQNIQIRQLSDTIRVFGAKGYGDPNPLGLSSRFKQADTLYLLPLGQGADTPFSITSSFPSGVRSRRIVRLPLSQYDHRRR